MEESIKGGGGEWMNESVECCKGSGLKRLTCRLLHLFFLCCLSSLSSFVIDMSS